MRYYTNHCWCQKSCWNDKGFLCEVIVSFNRIIENDILDNNDIKIEDQDFINLTEVKTLFDKESYETRLEIREEKIGFVDDDTKEMLKTFSTVERNVLKHEVIDWLNNNVKNNEENEKAWAIYNDEELCRTTNDQNIFFKRQIDALRFINHFSIYKEPIFYFDYFHDVRKDIDINKFKIILSSEKEKLNIVQEKETIFNFYDCRLLDWEDKKRYDDIELNKEEVKILIDKFITKS